MNKIIIDNFIKETDLEDIMNIWLQSNLDVHDFINKNYWINNFDMVKSIMPNASIYTAKLNSNIIGFIGMLDSYIAGIFIKKEYRGLGIGSLLLDKSKEKYDKLSLDVYKKNKHAYDFYINKGFKPIEEKIDANSEIEIFMEYNK